jgi:hypothetical protein
MWENIQVYRILPKYLPDESKRRLVLITGARQTGKTTLVKNKYATLSYYNLDAIEYRDQLSSISTFNWSKEVGIAVIDEIQKEPGLIDKIKFAFDESSLKFSVFTGSSQILLLKKVQETLAGRVSLMEIFPFMLRELIDVSGEIDEPILLNRLLAVKRIDMVLEPINSLLMVETFDLHSKAEEWLYFWGGMAPLIHITDPNDRKLWLKDYAIAYLERDLADLANLNDLKPFRKFQQISALRTSNLISYTELAKDAGISIESARRYLEYIRISYQTFLIQYKI